MRLVIQRVTSAKVTATENNKVVGKIGKGLFVLVGIQKGDTEEIAEKLASKLVNIRLMADDQNKMNLSVLDTKSEILAVSQFTLLADTKKGNRPSFVKAEDPDKAEALFNYIVQKLRDQKIKVQIGEFGSYMKINCELDGPVTIIYENNS